MASDPFSSLGFQPNKRLIRQNRNIRKYLTNHKGEVSAKHRKSLLGLRSKNHAKLFPTEPSSGLSERYVSKQARADARSAYQTKWQELGQREADVKAQLAALPTYGEQWRTTLSDLASKQAAQANAIADNLNQTNANVQQVEANQQAINADRMKGNRFAGESLQAADDAAKGRQALLGMAQANIRQIGQNTSDYSRNYAESTKKWQQEQMDNKRKLLQGIGVDKAETAKAIADRYATARSRVIGSEIDAKTQRAAAQLAQGKAKETIRSNLAKEAAARAQRREDKRHNLASEQNTRGKNAKGGGKSGSNGLTSTKIAENNRKINGLSQWVEKQGRKNLSGTASEIADILSDGMKNQLGETVYKSRTDDTFLAMAVATNFVYKGVTKKMLRMLKKNYGFTEFKFSPAAERAAKRAGNGA